MESLVHSNTDCQFCDGQRKGDRLKKSSSRGHPSLFFVQSVLLLVPLGVLSFSCRLWPDETYIESITYTLCKSAVCEPVEVLPCKSLICCNYSLGYLNKKQDTFEYPGC